VGGSYRLGAWRDDGTTQLTADGGDPSELLLAGLRGVLAAARGESAPADPAASAAVPIRGQGGDLGRVFAELAADLLAQLDANGLGLDEVRLDGLLRTDDGGFTAWGYAVGVSVERPPPLRLGLDGEPIVAAADGRLTLACRLRRD
jgi:hypothetical protein